MSYMTNTKNSDHDILIRLDTKVDNLTTELVMLRDNTTARVNELHTTKLDANSFKDFLAVYERELKEVVIKNNDFEDRLRRIEMRMWIAIGILMAMQILAPLLFRYVR